ncbi:MAG: ATP-binding protein [Caldilineales bacterium]|nr:ATP-binding protein [Caldilineales bacterium]
MTYVQAVCLLALLSYLGLLIFVGRKARRPESRAFLLFLLAMTVWQWSVTIVTFTHNPQVALFWYTMALGLGGSFGFFYALFVRQFLNIRGHPGVIWIGGLVTLFFALWTLGGGGFIITDIYWNPRTGFWLPELGWMTYPMGVGLYGHLAYGMAHLARHYRRTTLPLVRNRLRYLLLGIALVFAGSIVNFSDTLKAYPIDIVANVLNAIFIAYAILRYKLLDIGFVVKRGLFYFIPASILGISYYLTILAAVNLFHAVTGSQVALVSLVVAALVAVGLQPLYVRLQGWLDPLFFREKYDLNRMLARLSQTASTVLDLDRLTAILLQEITMAMHVEHAVIFLRNKESGDFRPVAQFGLVRPVDMAFRPDNPVLIWLQQHRGAILTRTEIEVLPEFKALWTREREELENLAAEAFVPLFARGELVGLLVLGPKRSTLPYSEDDRRALLTMANQTAIAVQNAWLYQTTVHEKERTELIINQAFSGIIVLDLDLVIQKVNPGAAALIGRPAADLVGKRFTEVFGLEMWDEGSPLYLAVQNGRAVEPVETVLVTADRRRDILLGVTPLEDGYLLNFADITRIKELDRLRSGIVATVSHELRTPLASIKGYTDLLLQEFEGDNRTLRHEFLTIINEETDRLVQLVSDLLDLSRLESGRFERKQEPLYLDELVREMAKTLEVQARQADVTLHLDLPDDLPPLLGDRTLLTAVVKNLLGNAIKFSLPGGKVEVRVRYGNGTVTLEVQDQGIGIPVEELPHLFTKFYRASTARKAGIRGTGLGLALGKEAVELHHGRVSATSEEGIGSCFRVVLPVMDGFGDGSGEGTLVRESQP